MSLAMQNAVLSDLEPLVGEWTIEIMLGDPPTPVHGQVSITWMDGGVFLVMRSSMTWEGPSGSVSVIGRDDALDDYSVLYFDARGVSRIYQMSFTNRVLKQWRSAPDFSQRFTGTLSEDGTTITAAWEKSTDGVTWEHDFDLTYTRTR
jgi:hypothetical protein